MILPIQIYGAAVLRKTAKEIDADYLGLQKLIDNMFETMYKAEGLGLAAPQIGHSIRLIVYDADCMSEDDPSLKDFIGVLINPRIIERKGETSLISEGCLSLPGIREEVERQDTILIEYYDGSFVKQTEELSGYKARIIQHEYDHLEGVLFVDHLASLKRKLLQGRLTAITKGKAEAKYKVAIPSV